MIIVRINNSDRTGDVDDNSLRITNQIQQRTDSCNFSVFQGSKPTENQDLKIYSTAIVSSILGAVITLKDSYQTNVLKFYADQVIFLRIGETDMERATVLSYDEATRQVTLTAVPTASIVENDSIGQLIFGGVIARVNDENAHSLSNLTYNVTGVDYTKIFDKKIVSDTWADVDSRYIINDFVNTTVNYNTTIDNMSYANSTDLRAVWIEASDGGNPSADLSDFMESISSATFGWTFSGGTALWAAAPTAKDLSAFTGVASGTPTKGSIPLWVKTSSFSSITSLTIRIGSSASDYIDVPLTLRNTTDWQYVFLPIAGITPTGTPVWTATDYVQIRVVETVSGSIKINGLRINADNSFTLTNVQSTPLFDDLRSPQIKPTALINQIAKTWEYVWYIDYERDIHFMAKETESAPFDITDTSDNFMDLKVDVDVSNVGNRIIVRGGEKTSTSLYSQVFQGDGVLREWVLKSKFNNLVATVDNNSTSHAAEATTTTTTIKITAHGFIVGDHIVNRTRSNALRQILTVPTADTFTVDAVASQASGDTISYFGVAVTDGVEGLTDETTVDYVANSNEKSIRATTSTLTLTSGNFIRFAYNERVPIQIQYTDTASANALKALGLGDGIFDLDPITDRNIQDINTAISIAEAKVREFSNAIVTGEFKTDKNGLTAGQILHIQQTTGRAIDENYVIQKVALKQDGGQFKDYFTYTVTFGTTLFGWIEFMQKLLRAKDSIELNVDDIVETYVVADETVESSETSTTALGGFKKVVGAEIAESSDVNNVVDTTKPWQWETSVGQGVPTRWGLFEWS